MKVVVMSGYQRERLYGGFCMNELVAHPTEHRSAPRNDAMLQNADERDAMHLALRTIVEGTATATGTEFFYALVRELAQALNVRHAFVCELLECRTRVRPLAFWFDGKFIDNTEFDLDGTPCEVVIRGETVYYTHKVYEMFPRQPELKKLGIESYFGCAAGVRIGERNDGPLGGIP
jgi:formate hydrogenlyase transcriptional activator